MGRQTRTNDHIHKNMGTNSGEFLGGKINVAKLQRSRLFDKETLELRPKEQNFFRSWGKSISVHRNSMCNRPKDKKGLVSMRK